MQSIKSRRYYSLLRNRPAQDRKPRLPLAEVRANFDELSARFFKMPAGVSREPVERQGLQGEWLRPAIQRTDGLVLYLHGGAYASGSIKSHRALASQLAVAAETPTFIQHYRLAPEHPFPAAVDDAFAVYTALLTAHPDAPIAVAGDSAGGGLAMALALRVRDARIRAPAALALMSPWTDLTLGNSTHQSKAAVDPFFPDSTTLGLAAKAYAGDRDLKTPLISPQFADLGGLPPTLIHVGELEALLDDSRILAERMQNQGTAAEIKVYPDMWHGWQLFAGRFREADQSVREIGQFLMTKLMR